MVNGKGFVHLVNQAAFWLRWTEMVTIYKEIKQIKMDVSFPYDDLTANINDGMVYFRVEIDYLYLKDDDTTEIVKFSHFKSFPTKTQSGQYAETGIVSFIVDIPISQNKVYWVKTNIIVQDHSRWGGDLESPLYINNLSVFYDEQYQNNENHEVIQLLDIPTEDFQISTTHDIVNKNLKIYYNDESFNLPLHSKTQYFEDFNNNWMLTVGSSISKYYNTGFRFNTHWTNEEITDI